MHSKVATVGIVIPRPSNALLAAIALICIAAVSLEACPPNDNGDGGGGQGGWNGQFTIVPK